MIEKWIYDSLLDYWHRCHNHVSEGTCPVTTSWHIFLLPTSGNLHYTKPLHFPRWIQILILIQILQLSYVWYEKKRRSFSVFITWGHSPQYEAVCIPQLTVVPGVGIRRTQQKLRFIREWLCAVLSSLAGKYWLACQYYLTHPTVWINE